MFYNATEYDACYDEPWDSKVASLNITRWLYIDDLFPKEGLFQEQLNMKEKDNLCNTILALINIVRDPSPIVKYLITKDNNDTPIKDIIISLSFKEIISLWDILKVSKYTKDPSSIVKQLNIDIKNYILYEVSLQHK